MSKIQRCIDTQRHAGYIKDADEAEKELAEYRSLDTLMSCGHAKRYVVSADEGTSYCAMCELDAANKALKAWNR
jgi:hypothetical protein